MSLTELPPEPTPRNNDASRLARLEIKLNVLIVLVSVTILAPILGWLFGLVQTSAWLMLVLLAAAFVLAMFRERIPGFLKRAARKIVLKAFQADEPPAKS